MQEQRFLLLTAFLLVLVGGPAVYSVVQEPRDTAVISQDKSTVSVHTVTQRTPANAEETDSAPRNLLKSKSVVVELNCKNQNPIEVDGNLLRITGGNCINEKWKNVSLVNQANGFTASVIFLKNQRFTTDFVDLKEGDNQLALHATDEKGESVVRKILVKRRFSASAEAPQN